MEDINNKTIQIGQTVKFPIPVGHPDLTFQTTGEVIDVLPDMIIVQDEHTDTHQVTDEQCKLYVEIV